MLPGSETHADGADRDQLDPILDACVAAYSKELDEDGQSASRAKPK